MKMVVFDLDGTLLDTSLGIFNSVRYVEKELGLVPVEDEELKRFLGPPPKEMYKKIYCLDEDTAREAVKRHREYGRTSAIFEAKIYDGIIMLLKKLRQSGYLLGVATLKRQEVAEKILEQFGIINFFDIVVGMDEDESYTKCMIIRKAMQHMQAEEVVMIGDSLYDFEGAQVAGVEFIGVLYGFFFKEGQEYPFKTALRPEEILAHIEANSLYTE